MNFTFFQIVWSQVFDFMKKIILQNLLSKSQIKVEIWEIYSHWKKFRQNNYLIISLVYTVWKSAIKHDHAKKISWDQLFNNFFSKNVDLTEEFRFFRKNRDRLLVIISTLNCGITITFTEFLPKMRESKFPEFPQWKSHTICTKISWK